MIKLFHANCNIFLFLILFNLCSSNTKANLLNETNLKSYYSPLLSIFETRAYTGLFRKANPHKILGFDLTADINYTSLPLIKTTYDFTIPNESIPYIYQFQFLKSDLDLKGYNNLLKHIPDANQDTIYNDAGLFIDIPINFSLPLNQLINPPHHPAQNFFGDSASTNLQFNFDLAGDDITNQVANGIWDKVRASDGIGESLNVYNKETDQLIYIIESIDSTSFRDYLYEKQDIYNKIKNELNAQDIQLIVPGGSSHLIKDISAINGIAFPIIQASIGLPFHTEIFLRALPEMQISSIGSIQIAGIGGKIGISDHLNDIFNDKNDFKVRELNIPDVSYITIKNIIDSDPLDIDTLQLQNILLHIDSLNINIKNIDSYSRDKQNTNSIIIIQDQLQSMLDRPELYKKVDQSIYPIDISLGYYFNNYIFKTDGPEINSISHLASIQASKTFNAPYIPFLGEISFYGGLNFNFFSSNIKYNYSNFIKDANDISFDIHNNNIFNHNLGIRMRILFLDTYFDYNFGENNSVNIGFGITYH